MKPLFEKQRVKAVCPDDGKIRWWVALYKSDGELYFWCIHDKPAFDRLTNVLATRWGVFVIRTTPPVTVGPFVLFIRSYKSACNVDIELRCVNIPTHFGSGPGFHAIVGVDPQPHLNIVFGGRANL